MYGITQYDIKRIDEKIDYQKRYLANFAMDFVGDGMNLLDNTYSANLNPKKYFAEINNRVNTMFTNAKEKGLKPVFVTLTAPSKYHKKHKDGRLAINPNETAKALTQVWNKFTNLQVFQKMKKELGHGLVYFRVYEPHRSSVPHLHAMIFIPVNYILEVKRKYKEYFSSSSWGANKKAIDFKYTWYKQNGGAIGYIMKYITKTFRDEENAKTQHAVYWYIKHKIRRFLSSRTLAPLSIYRKVRYFFKDKYKDDFQTITNKLQHGVIKKSFDDTMISYIFYNHDIGEVDEVILWGKNTELLIEQKAKQDLEKIRTEKQKQEIRDIKKARLENKNSFARDVTIFVSNGDKYIYNTTTYKFTKAVVIPSRLNDYELYSYFMKLDDMDISQLDIKHYLVTKNEMVRRGLLLGVIESLNDIF